MQALKCSLDLEIAYLGVPRIECTRGNGFKLKEGKLNLDVRKKFFTQRVMRLWTRLPKEAVYASQILSKPEKICLLGEVCFDLLHTLMQCSLSISSVQELHS